MVNINPNHTSGATILFNEKVFNEFKDKYNREKHYGDEHVFVFKGHQILVAYATYLIQYINTQLTHE